MVSGTWRFGYGAKFDEAKLAVRPPGSVYSDPGSTDEPHFAQTRHESAILQISGYGPTDTVYVHTSDDPSVATR